MLQVLFDWLIISANSWLQVELTHRQSIWRKPNLYNIFSALSISRRAALDWNTERTVLLQLQRMCTDRHNTTVGPCWQAVLASWKRAPGKTDCTRPAQQSSNGNLTNLQPYKLARPSAVHSSFWISMIESLDVDFYYTIAR